MLYDLFHLRSSTYFTCHLKLPSGDWLLHPAGVDQLRSPTRLDDVLDRPDNLIAAALRHAHTGVAALKSFLLVVNLQIPRCDYHNVVPRPASTTSLAGRTTMLPPLFAAPMPAAPPSSPSSSLATSRSPAATATMPSLTRLEDILALPENRVSAILCRAHARGATLKSFLLALNLQILGRDCHIAIPQPASTTSSAHPTIVSPLPSTAPMPAAPPSNPSSSLSTSRSPAATTTTPSSTLLLTAPCPPAPSSPTSSTVTTPSETPGSKSSTRL